MNTVEFEGLLAQRSVAQREVEGLASLDDFVDVRAVVQRDGVNESLKRLRAVPRFLAASAAVDAAILEIRKTEAAVEAELDRLRQGPQPLPGSQAFETLTRRVRELEGGELPTLRELTSRLEAGENVSGHLQAVIERARRAAPRVANALLEIESARALATVKAAVEANFHRAFEVTNPIQAYERFCAVVDEAMLGETVPAAPMLVLDSIEAWRRLLRREEPRLESPASPAAEPSAALAKAGRGG